VSTSFRLGFFCIGGLRSFSSIPYYIAKALSECPGVEVVPLSPGRPYRPSLGSRVLKRAHRQFLGQHYLWEKAPARCQYISRQIDRVASEHGVDAVLLFGSEGCGYCETDIPLYGYSDSIFGSRIGLYPDQPEGGLSPASVREGVLVQQRGLDRLRKLFVSSRWAIERAVCRFHYRLPEGRIEVVGIGANLPKAPPPAIGPPPASTPLWLTWVGNFWERKGGDHAVATTAALRGMGVDARLDVVGAVEPRCHERWVYWHGKLSYEDPCGFETLRQVYARAAALVLPSDGDLTPIAICEAFAFSRPVIATPVGGIPEMVTNGRTGFLLEKTSPCDWAERIAEAARSDVLHRMRPACRQTYDSGFRWEAICGRMLATMGARERQP
jgi:glycosyltransferase involved in cell wall biosynthesis